MKVTYYFDWFDFGFCLKGYRLSDMANYKVGIDFQILWFDFYFELFCKHKYKQICT
jgi:hypothetical protein